MLYRYALCNFNHSEGGQKFTFNIWEMRYHHDTNLYCRFLPASLYTQSTTTNKTLLNILNIFKLCPLSPTLFLANCKVFGEVRANLNDHYHYPVHFFWLICRRRKRNRTGVLCRVCRKSCLKSIVISVRD